MTNVSSKSRLLIVGGALFLLFSCALVVTRAPWWDEGFLAGPSGNLARGGPLGAHVLSTIVPSGEHYLYWNMPLYFLVLAAWFKIFGFGFYTMRLLSVVCALASLVAWYLIVVYLLKDRLAGTFAVVLLCTDYVFVMSAATGRMDMMTAAFGLAGLAGYLKFRELRLMRAVTIASVCTALAVFCHPLGLIYLGVTLVAVIHLDWRRLRLLHVVFALAPFLICALCWLIYILNEPRTFVAQMGISSQRAHFVWNPFELIRRELIGRYLMFYYLKYQSPTLSLVARLKVLGLVPYAAGFIMALSSNFYRSKPAGRLLIAFLPLAAFLLAMGDVVQFPQYFIHVFPFAIALLAASLSRLWMEKRSRLFVAGMFLFSVVVGAGGLTSQIGSDTYRALYLPVVNVIQPFATTSTLIDGPCEFIFALGDFRMIDGLRRDKYNSYKPDFIVIGRAFGLAKLYEPEIYNLIYRNSMYTVYRLK